MKYDVFILTDAEHDIENAFVWYEIQQVGLGVSFFNSLDSAIIYISNSPFSCGIVHKSVRRYVIKKFPYGVYYKVNETKKAIQIIGIFHFKRSVKVVRKRK